MRVWAAVDAATFFFVSSCLVVVCRTCVFVLLVEEEEEEEIRQKQQHIDDPTIGAPYIVFITSSAIRAVEIGRAFKKITMNTRVVKLFAKHIKVSYCTRTRARTGA